MGWREEIQQPKQEPKQADLIAPTSRKWRDVVAPAGPTAGLAETPTGRLGAEAGFGPKPVSGRGAGFMAGLRTSIPEEPETKLQQLAESVYPGDPEGRQKVGFIGGRLAFINKEGTPEFADVGVTTKAGQFVANAPEIAGATIGAFSPATPIGGAVIGGVAGKAWKQALSAFLFEEPVTPGQVAKGAITEAGVTALGGGLGKAFQLAREGGAVRGVERFDLPKATERIERIKQSTGIELDIPQASQFPQLLALKKWASKYPSEASQIIDDLDKKQAGQVADAVTDRVLNVLSKETDPSRLAESGINTAKAAIELVKQARAAKTAPLYKAVERQALDPAATAGLKADPVFAATLGRIQKDPVYVRDLKGFSENQIKTWDAVKKDIDAQIEKAQSRNDANRVRILTKAKGDLVDTLESFVPAYKDARLAHEQITRDVLEPLEKGTVGVLARIKGPRMAQTAALVMRDLLANPHATRAVKYEIERNQGQQAWKDLLRLQLGKEFDKNARIGGDDLIELTGRFRTALVGTPQRKEAMKAALDQEGVTAFDDVMEALDLIAREHRKRGGSDTAFNALITAQQSENVRSVLSKTVGRVVTGAKPWEWDKSLKEFGTKSALENNSVRIAEALTDPAKLKSLRELRKLPPNQLRAAAILSVVFPGHLGVGTGVRAVTAPIPAQEQQLQVPPQ